MSGWAAITGASSGIGQAYAERLAADGWNVVVVARRRHRLEELAARLQDANDVDVRVIEADLSRHEDISSVTRELEAMPVGMLVNNAALAYYGPFENLPPSQAEELMHLNVLAPVMLTQTVIAAMRRLGSGAVINVASLLAFSGPVDNPNLPARAVYAASKAFLVTFTQVLASELRDSAVRIQVVCPGIVRSEFHSRQGLDMTGSTRMEPESIVEASLLDLERGVVVCLPPVADESILDRVNQAQSELLRSTRMSELPQRYRQ